MKKNLFFTGLLALMMLLSGKSWGQTNPAAQSLPYSQNFATLTGTSPSYPVGWQGWTISGSLSTSFPTAASNGDQAIAVVTNTSTSAHVGDFIGKMGLMSTGSAMRAICLAINTSGNTNIIVSFDAATQRTENTRQNEMGLQYRVGTSGTFTNVTGSAYQNQMTPTNTSGTGSVKIENIQITLPSECNNQSVVQLRWLIRDVSGSGNRPGFSIDNISVTGTASSNSITTGAVSTAPFCVTASTSAAGTVAYVSTGDFNGTFTAQLSNASGSFASPISIGSGASPISITIPAGTASGTGYKIRVVNDDPETIGSESTAFEIINGAKNVSAASADVRNASSVLSWTNPNGCYDEIMIVGKATTAVSESPSGDGSAYVANLTFGLGTAFDGGFVLYKGTSSPQTVTGLINGTVYHYTFFTRNGTSWSSGITATATPAIVPTLTEIVLPKFIQGNTATNSTRVPYAYRVQLNDLSPNTTYRYINQVINSGDGPTINGAGNVIYVTLSGDFIRTSAPDFTTNYGEFTTDGSGSYTGWFITEPSGNARFTPGQTVSMRIRLNDGEDGILPVTYLTTYSTITVINFGNTPASSLGTGLRGSSFAPDKSFVFLYDNTGNTGRPLSGTFVENDGTANTSANSYVGFYNDNVNGFSGSWGSIIPNVNSNGVKGIEFRSLSTGNLLYSVTDSDGNWNGVNTINPTSGTTALVVPHNFVDDFTIASGANVMVAPNGSLTINGTLTNSAGSAGLVIESDATGTGSLIHNTDNVPATMQRYITGSTDLLSRYYHHVSIPLNNSVQSSQFSGSYLFSFNQATQTWNQITQDNVSLNNNQGYMIFYPNTETTYNFVGQLNNGAFVASTTTDAIDEYSLVPNPYPSAIDWDAATGWTKTNLLDAIWIWNPVAQNYAAYGTQAGTNGGSRYIAPGQAFFVKSSAASPLLSMNNNVRLHNAQAFFNTPINNQMLRVRAEANGFSDEAIVRFHADASLNYEANLDVDKLRGNEAAPQLFTLASDMRELSINTVPFATETFVMPLAFESGFEGEVVFSFSELNSFEEGATIFLEDKTTGEMINLQEQQTYSFVHNQSNDPDRFNLHFFGVTGIDMPEAKSDYHIWSRDRKVYISIPELNGQQAQIEMFDVLGSRIFSSEGMMNSPSVVRTMNSGVAIVRVTSQGRVYTTKLFIQ